MKPLPKSIHDAYVARAKSAKKFLKEKREREKALKEKAKN